MGTDDAARSAATCASSSALDTPVKVIVPRARGDQLLQGARAAISRGHRLDVDPGGQEGGEPFGQRVHLDAGRLGPGTVEDHVEVFGHDSHPVGRASPKLSWGRGENPFGVGQREAGPAQGPSPTSGPRPVGW